MPSIRRSGIFILIVFLYCIYVFTNAGRTHIIDEVSLFALAESIGLRGEVDTNAIAWTQWVNSPGEVLGAFGPDGEVYSKKGPAPAFLVLPWYLILRAVVMLNIHIGLLQGTLLWNGVVTAFTAALLWLTAVRLGYSDRIGMWLGLLFGLCTIAWPYANQFFGEPLSALSLLACFYGILAWKQAGRSSWMWLAGIGAGVALATVTAHALLLVVFGCYFLIVWWRFGDNSPENQARETNGFTQRERPPLLPALAGLITPILVAGGLLLLYNYARFGSPFDTGYHFDSGEGFTTPLWQGLWGLLFSPYRSVFLHTPLFLLSVAAFVPFVRRHRWEGAAIAGLSVVLIVLYSMWWMWWGGYAWGPRFLVPLTPFWVLLLAPLLVRLGMGEFAGVPATRLRIVWSWFSWAVIALSFAVQVLAVSINFVTYETILRNEFFETNWEDPLEFGPPAQKIGDFLLSPLFGQLRLVWRGGFAANSDLAWLWAGGQMLWLPVMVGAAAIITIGWALLMWLRGANAAGDPERAIPSPPMTLLLALIPFLMTGVWLGAAAEDPVYGEFGAGYHGAIAELCQRQRPGDVLVTVAPYGYHIPMNWLGAHCRSAMPVYGYATSSMEHPEVQRVMDRLLEESERVFFITSGLPPSDPENTLERWLAQHAFKADDRWFDNERLLEYATPARLLLQQFTQHNLFLSDPTGNSVTIVQSRTPDTGVAGAITPVEITYMLHAPANADLRWFVQLLAADGSAVVQLDSGPDDNYTPFTTLRPNELNTERAGLRLPVDLPPGTYQVIAGLYNPAAEGAPRLRAADGRDYLVLSTLTVEP